jgi:HK97 family phage major capsid protein
MEEIELIPRIKQINEQRLQAWESNKKLLEDTKGDFSAEQRAEWDRTDALIQDLDRQRDLLTTAERRQAESERIREHNRSVFGEQRTARAEYREAEHLRQWLRGDLGRASLELDISPGFRQDEYMRQGMSWKEARALAWDTGSIASGVPVITASSLYQYLTAGIALMRMGTTKLATGNGDEMLFPRVAAHGIGTQVSGQGTALAGTDPTFGSMRLDAYKFGQLVIVATEVLQDTGFDVVGFVGANIGRALAQVVDQYYVTGTGSNQPQGVMATAITGSNGTIATGGSLITPTYENLVDLVYSVNDQYRAGGNAAFLMRDATAGIIRKIRSDVGGTSGQTMWLPSLTAGIIGGQPDALLGFPVYTDPNVASCASNAKIVAFGDWSAFWIRTVGNVVLDRDDSRYFDTDQVGFRGKLRTDSDCIDATALNLLKQSV